MPTDAEMGYSPGPTDADMGYTPSADEWKASFGPPIGGAPAPAPEPVAPPLVDEGTSQSNLKNRLWGTLEGIADIVSLARSGGRTLSSLVSYAAQGDPSTESTKQAMAEDTRFQRRRSNLLATGAGAFGAHEPQTTLDKAQAQSQQNVTYALPAVAAAVGSGGATTIPQIVGGLTGIAGATLSPFFERANTRRFVAKTPQMSPLHQLLLGAENFGINLAASAVIPVGMEVGTGTAMDKMLDMRAQKVIDNATPEQLQALQELSDVIQDAFKERFKGAAKNTPKMSMKDIVKNAGEIRALFTGGERTGIKMIDELLPLLDEAAASWPKWGGPTSVQAAQGLAGQVMTEQAEGLADVGPLRAPFVKNVQMQHEAFLRNIADEFQKRYPTGNVDDYMAMYEAYTSALRQGARNAWKKVGWEPVFDLTEDATLSKIDDLVREADRAEDLLPGWVRNPPENMTMNGLQNEMAALNDIIYRADDLKPGTKQQAVFAIKSKQILGDLLDQMPKRNNTLYERARLATLEWKSLMDPTTDGGEVARVLFRKIGGGEEDIIRTALKNESTMDRAISLVGETDDGRAALQAGVLKEWFGVPDPKAFGGELVGPNARDFATKSSAQIRAFAAKHERPMRLLFGDEQMTAWLKFADYLQQASTERLGTKGAVYGARSAGWGNKFAQTIVKAKNLANPIAIGEKAITELLNTVSDDAAYVILQQEAFTDPGLLARLLRVPTKATLPAYILDWQKVTKGAATMAANQAAARIGSGDALDSEIDAAEQALSLSMGVPASQVPQDAVIKYVVSKGRY